VRRLLFLALLPLACRASSETDDGVTREQVVLDEPRQSQGEPKQPPEWFDDQIARVEQERKEGLLFEALQRVHRARSQDPGPEHATALADLQRSLNHDVLELPALEARVEPEKTRVVFGDPVRVRIFLRNTGTRPVRVPLRMGTRAPTFHINDPLPPDPSSRSLFVIDLVRRDTDIRAHTVTTTRRVLRPLPEAFGLEPGATKEIVLDLGPAGNEELVNGVRTITIRGEFRPIVVELGGLRRWEPVPLRPGTLRSFRANYEHLADDPVRRIGQAIEKGAAAHLLTAAALVPKDRRRDAVDVLVESVQGTRFIDFAIFAALHDLTGIELGRDAAAWQAWWPRVRETYFAEPEEKPRDVPAFDRSETPQRR